MKTRKEKTKECKLCGHLIHKGECKGIVYIGRKKERCGCINIGIKIKGGKK